MWFWSEIWPRKVWWKVLPNQPALTGVRTYFMTWQIRMKWIVQKCTIVRKNLTPSNKCSNFTVRISLLVKRVRIAMRLYWLFCLRTVIFLSPAVLLYSRNWCLSTSTATWHSQEHYIYQSCSSKCLKLHLNESLCGTTANTNLRTLPNLLRRYDTELVALLNLISLFLSLSLLFFLDFGMAEKLP